MLAFAINRICYARMMLELEAVILVRHDHKKGLDFKRTWHNYSELFGIEKVEDIKGNI